MFLSRNKKNNVYPCKPQFYYIKVGFKGVKIIYTCFRDDVCSVKNYVFMHLSVFSPRWVRALGLYPGDKTAKTSLLSGI